MSLETDLLERIALPSLLAETVGMDAFGVEWKPSPFLLDIEREIVAACLDEEEQDWFIVNCPNQVGKTSWVGVLLILWYIGMFPDKQVIFITFSDAYSGIYGKLVRDLMKKWGKQLFGLEIDPGSDAAGDWKIKGHRGGMLSTGIGGQIMGRQGHLVIIDDVLKTMIEAASTATKEGHWTDWKGTIFGRRQPGSVYVVTSTRLAGDDLSGRMMEEQNHGGGIPWVRLIYPGICEPPPEYEGPPEMFVDRLGRRVGEPLECRFTRKQDTIEDNWFTQAKKGLNNDLLFDCMIQQNPARSEGGMFPEAHWKYALRQDWPQLYVKVRSWDLASTKGGGDFTTGALLGRDYEGDIYIIGRERGQWGSEEGMNKVKSTALADGAAIPIQIEQERSGAGVNLVEFYRKELKGYQVVPAKADGTKEQRATPYSILQQGGHVWLPADDEDAEWVKVWVKEHSGMMGDQRRPPHDDQIDTAAYGVMYLLDHSIVEIADPNEPMDIERQMAMEQMLQDMGY